MVNACTRPARLLSLISFEWSDGLTLREDLRLVMSDFSFE